MLYSLAMVLKYVQGKILNLNFHLIIEMEVEVLFMDQVSASRKVHKNACMSEITLIYIPGMYLNSRKEIWL